MYIYICIYIYIYICVCVCKYIYICIYTYIYIYAYLCILYMYVCIYVCVYIDVCVYICMYMCICIYVCVCKCIFIYIYIYIYIYLCVCIYAHSAHSTRKSQMCLPVNHASLILFYFCVSLMSYTHTQKSRAQSEKHCRRRGASSGQKTRGSIEGEKPPAAGIRRFLWQALVSLKFKKPIDAEVC